MAAPKTADNTKELEFNFISASFFSNPIFILK